MNLKVQQFILIFAFFLATFFLTILPFTKNSPIDYAVSVIFPMVYSNRDFIAVHTFNLWQFIATVTGEMSFMGINPKAWSILLLVILNLLAIYVNKERLKLKNIFSGVFIVSGGSYIFSIGMVDRYYFTGVTFLLLLVIFDFEILKIWLLVATVFLLNLFFSWGYPFAPEIYRTFWADIFWVRAFSLMQVILFLLVLFVCLKRQYKIRNFTKSANLEKN